MEGAAFLHAMMLEKRRQDAKQHLHDAIECLETETNYNEAIERLHNCLKLAPECHPFRDVHDGAIMFLGLAHVRKNEFEQALNNLARLPPDTTVDIEYIPSVSVYHAFFYIFTNCIFSVTITVRTVMENQGKLLGFKESQENQGKSGNVLYSLEKFIFF